ncbi:MAG TPA: IPT/TIG domain-containing protein [Chloroflexia bacterium]|nr:IPT/TIG domain-containing protein [Chloroflexia bacterium]
MELITFGSGFVLLAAIWVLYILMSGRLNPLVLVSGADNRPSTSKLQFFLWTVVVLYAYAVIWAARYQLSNGNVQALPDIPPNLLLAMGFSLTTVTAAKGITTAYVSSGRLVKNPPPKEGSPANATAPATASGLSALGTDDDGDPDLSKMQMLAWTLVAIGVFLAAVVVQVREATPQLPDIDASLMVLMGLGQGAYLGKKLVTTDIPRLTGLTPGGGEAGITTVTLSGTGFGVSQNGNQITFDGFPLTEAAATWTDEAITFKIPAKYPGGGEWPSDRQITATGPVVANRPVQVGVIVYGNNCPNTLPLTITSPLPSGPSSGASSGPVNAGAAPAIVEGQLASHSSSSAAPANTQTGAPATNTTTDMPPTDPTG